VRFLRKPPLPPKRRRANRFGFVLLSVIVVILMASMVAISLLFRLKAEDTAAVTGAGSEQAHATAMSGVYEAIRIAAAYDPADLDWRDNPATFRDQLVVDDAVDKWYFTVFTQGEGELEPIRYGLTDEASKVNIHTASEEMLTRVMTSYLAHGLMDFVDTDDLPHPQGAEQEYYDTLAHPYAAVNGPLSSIYELFLVRGFTPRIVYGEDANLNFTLDANEDDGDERFPPDNGDGKLNFGARTLLTVCSYDVDDDNDGQIRRSLNNTNELFVGLELPQQLTNFVYAMRRNNIKMSHPADLLEAKTKLKDEKGREVEIASGVGKAELPLVLDKLTGTPEYHLHGLINVNTASAHVLRALPEMDDAIVDQIVSMRKGLRPEQRKTTAWLYEQGILDAPKFKALAPRITTRSLQFHFHVIGYGLPSGRYRVLEAIIDVAGVEPVVSYLRDVTKAGLPFRLPTIEAEPAGNRGLTSRSSRANKEVPHG
jgi:hypothetical protein